MRILFYLVSSFIFSFSCFAADTLDNDLVLIRTEGRLIPAAAFGAEKEVALVNLIKLCDRIRNLNFESEKSTLAQIQDTFLSNEKHGGTFYIQGNCAIVGESLVAEDMYLAPLGSEIVDIGENNLVSIKTISLTQIRAVLGENR